MSMVVEMVPLKGGIGGISPNWQEKYHLYTTYSPCRTWGMKNATYLPPFRGTISTTIDHGPINDVSKSWEPILQVSPWIQRTLLPDKKGKRWAFLGGGESGSLKIQNRLKKVGKNHLAIPCDLLGMVK